MASTAQITIRTLGHKFPRYGRLLKTALPIIHSAPGTKHQVSTTLKGFHYTLDLRDYIQQQIFYFGCYDARGVKLMVDICRKIACRNALDIGANIGNHAVHLSEVCQNIYAFEPNCTPFNIFAKALSTKESSIHLNRFGLADKDGEYDFYENARNLGGSSFVSNHVDKLKISSIKTLPLRHASYVIQEMNIQQIDFVKIDVEGFEVEVLRGAKEAIIENQPIIDFNFNQVTRSKLGNLNCLQNLLPNYRFLGTKKTRLLSAELRLEAFNFNQSYRHVIAVPKRFAWLY